MSETNELTFSLRERSWLSTTLFTPGATTSQNEPGQTIRVVCDPIGSMISTSSSMSTGAMHYSCPLALTLSRFRDFKYLGTKISLVPAATTGQVDPAHISMTAGSNNYMHPRDVGNMIHWRRWVGGNFRIPSVRPTGVASTGVYYTANDSYDLDAAWLSDSRFNHALVSDGFSMFVRPLRARVETSAIATASVFGYYTESNAAYKSDDDSKAQVRGQTMLTAGDVVPDSWVPNPFAGLKYTVSSDTYGAGNEQIYVSGINKTFPWFADYPDISTVISDQSAYLIPFISRLKQRFYAPVCILRLPPAYGSVYYYTLYMRHYFAVRRPYITNGVYVAAKIQAFVPSNGNDALGSTERLLTPLEDDDRYHVVQMVSPDPYGASDSPDTLSMDDLGDSIWLMDEKDHEEPVEEEPAEKEPVEVKEDGSGEEDGRGDSKGTLS